MVKTLPNLPNRPHSIFVSFVFFVGKTSFKAFSARIRMSIIILPQFILPQIILTHLQLVKSPRKSGRWRGIKAD